MKEVYERPEVEIVMLEPVDIITQSCNETPIF